MIFIQRVRPLANLIFSSPSSDTYSYVSILRSFSVCTRHVHEASVVRVVDLEGLLDGIEGRELVVLQQS